VTLEDMRGILRTNIFDETATFLSDDQANQYINLALHHVENLVESFQAHILFEITPWVEEEPIIVDNEDDRIILILPKPDNVRRLLGADRVDLTNDDDPSLKIISFEAAIHERRGSPLEKPPAFDVIGKIGLVRPLHGISLRFYYIKSLPDLLVDDSIVEKMPLHHQILIPAYATILALSAENSDTTQWRQNFAEMAMAAGLAITERAQQPQEVRE